MIYDVPCVPFSNFHSNREHLHLVRSISCLFRSKTEIVFLLWSYETTISFILLPKWNATSRQRMNLYINIVSI